MPRFSQELMDLLNEHVPVVEGHKPMFNQLTKSVEVENTPGSRLYLSEASFNKAVDSSIQLTLRHLLDTASYMVEMAEVKAKQDKNDHMDIPMIDALLDVVGVGRKKEYPRDIPMIDALLDIVLGVSKVKLEAGMKEEKLREDLHALLDDALDEMQEPKKSVGPEEPYVTVQDILRNLCTQ